MFPAKTSPGKGAGDEEAQEEPAEVRIISQEQPGWYTQSTDTARNPDSEYSLQDLSGCS